LFQRGIGASIRQIVFLQIIEEIKLNTFTQNLKNKSFLSHGTKRVLEMADSVEDAFVPDPA